MTRESIETLDDLLIINLYTLYCASFGLISDEDVQSWMKTERELLKAEILRRMKKN